MNRYRKRRPVMMIGGEPQPVRTVEVRRRILVDWCKLVGDRLIGAKSENPLSEINLTPRMRQVLTCLLAGDSEKQVALKLQLSHHTVHEYVKKLHRALGVSSRGELLARFVQQPRSMEDQNESADRLPAIC